MLRGDKLIALRDELLAKFNVGEEPACSREQFEAILDELLCVEVPMLDDGVRVTATSCTSSGLRECPLLAESGHCARMIPYPEGGLPA